MRARKPCVRLRRTACGWKVCFIFLNLVKVPGAGERARIVLKNRPLHQASWLWITTLAQFPVAFGLVCRFGMRIITVVWPPLRDAFGPPATSLGDPGGGPCSVRRPGSRRTYCQRSDVLALGLNGPVAACKNELLFGPSTGGSDRPIFLRRRRCLWWIQTRSGSAVSNVSNPCSPNRMSAPGCGRCTPMLTTATWNSSHRTGR